MYTYPHTIQSKNGEKMIIKGPVIRDGMEVLDIEGFTSPGAGPAMHVHWKQDEGITVISGKMGVEIPGKEPVYYGPGETATFLRGTWHRFWNAGEDTLHIKGWVGPPQNFEYFITNLFEAFDKGKNGRPELTTAAFLMTRYKSEFDVAGMPGFVKNVIIPISYFFGKIGGAHKRFKDAPQPLK